MKARVKRQVKLNPGTLTKEEMEYGRKIGQLRQRRSRETGLPDQTFTEGQSSKSDEIGGQAEVFEQKKCAEDLGEILDIAEVDAFHTRGDVGGINVRYAGKPHYKQILKHKDKDGIPQVSISGNPEPPEFCETGWIDPGQIREIYASLMEVLEGHDEAIKAINEFLKPYWLKDHEEFAIPRNWLNYMDTLNRKFGKK
jgi:hypothetical protein